MGHGHPDLGDDRPQHLGRPIERLDPVVQVEDLAAALDLAPDRPFDQLLVPGTDVGPYRPPPFGRGLDHRDVPQPRHRHLERPGDRGRGHREDVDLELHLAQQLLLLDAEALLLVDDHQPEVVGLDVPGEQPMGSDQYVHASTRPVGQDLPGLGCGGESADPLDPEGEVAEPLGEGPQVLLGEDRGRRQQDHLLAVGGGLCCRPEGDLRLPVADVAADQSIHRLGGFHVGLDGLDRRYLVRRLAVREGRLECQQPLRVLGEGVPGPRPALGVEVDQLAGHLGGGLPSPRLQVLPLLAAEGREGRLGKPTRVAGELLELIGRGEDAVLPGVLEEQVVAGRPGDLPGLEAREPCDPVVLVDHEVPDPQAGSGQGKARWAGILDLPGPVDQTSPRIDGEAAGRPDESLADPGLEEGHSRLLGRIAVRIERDLEPVERVPGPLGLPGRLEGDDHPVATRDEPGQLGLGLDRVAGGRLGKRCPDGQLTVHLTFRRPSDLEQGPLGERSGHVHVEVTGVIGMECRGRVLPVVLQGRPDLLGSDQDDRRLGWNELERCPEHLDREHLLDPHRLAALVRLLDRHPGECPVVGVELGRRSDRDPVEGLGRPLGEGGELADRLDLVSEQLDPGRSATGRREQVEDPSPDRELTAFEDLLDPLVTGVGKPLGSPTEVDRIPGLDQESGRPERCIGNCLGQGDGAGHDDRGRIPPGIGSEGIDRLDPHPGQVGWRADLGLIARTTGWIEVDRT